MSLRSLFTALALLFGLSLSPVLHAQAWTVGGTGLAGSNVLTSVAYGNGRFVAASGFGTKPGIVSSRDGLAWSYTNTSIPLPFRVISVNGTFYVLADKSIWRGTDGTNWEKIYAPDQPNGLSSRNLIASNGTSMLLTPNSPDATLEFSPDLRTWRRTPALPSTAPNLAFFEIKAIAAFRGRYFVVYLAGASLQTVQSYAVVTNDGLSWTTVPALAGAQTIAASEERLLAVNGLNVVTTTDGTTFVTTPTTADVPNSTISQAGGRFFTIQRLISSRDGLAWSSLGAITFPFDGSLIFSEVAFGNGRFVAVGHNIGSGGSLSFTDAVRTLAGSGPPTFSAPPAALSAAPGGTITLAAALDVVEAGTTYRWFRDGTLLAGATASTYTIAAVSTANLGRYSVEARNSLGTTLSDVAILAIAVAPTVSVPPVSLARLSGQSATFSVTAGGDGPFTYQWLRNDTALPGATNATLTINSPLPADAGEYRVRITNAGGSITSASATLTVTPISRISNLSVLTDLSAGADFTVGYVIGGAGTLGGKPLVLRAVGPSLATLNVAGALDDPKFETFAGSTKTAEIDNWGGAPALSAAFTAVGAFPFIGPASRDAAVATTFPTGNNSVKITAAGAGSGLVLAEIYDAAPDATFTNTTSRLLNVSVLKPLGEGFTVGFTVAGTVPKSILIRAIGPGLGSFGVADTVSDPQLALFKGSTKIAENNDWGGTPTLTAVFTSVGAFSLSSASKDSALLIDLAPGGYSVQVTGVNGATGMTLVEVYEAR